MWSSGSLCGSFSPSQDSYCRRAGSAHRRQRRSPAGQWGTLTMALCPQAQIVLTLVMEIGQFHQTARYQRNRSENPSPARSRAPANRIHPPSRPADCSVPGQKLRFVCNDDIRATGFIKGITDISIGQDDRHPAVQIDAWEDSPPAVPIVDPQLDKPQTFIPNFSSSNCVTRTWTDWGKAPLRHI